MGASRVPVVSGIADPVCIARIRMSARLPCIRAVRMPRALIRWAALLAYASMALQGTVARALTMMSVHKELIIARTLDHYVQMLLEAFSADVTKDTLGTAYRVLISTSVLSVLTTATQRQSAKTLLGVSRATATAATTATGCCVSHALSLLHHLLRATRPQLASARKATMEMERLCVSRVLLALPALREALTQRRVCVQQVMEGTVLRIVMT
eukprot:Rmarinus@m.29467